VATLLVFRLTDAQLSNLSLEKPITSACTTALKRVAATCATSSAQKTWTTLVEEGEVNSVVQDAGRVTPIRTRLLADLKRASEPIAKLMTNNADETGDQL